LNPAGFSWPMSKGEIIFYIILPQLALNFKSKLTHLQAFFTLDKPGR
jgi:hypothetical protein